MSLLEARGLRFAYPGRQAGGAEEVLRGADLRLGSSERLGLVGDNGSGKSTLLLLLLGLEHPTAGQVLLDGEPVRDAAGFAILRRQVGLLFQNPDDQLFAPTVLEDVAFGPLNLGLSPNEAQDRAHETLNRLELSHLAERTPQHLSGGEKRMAALAGLLAMRPRAILLDEPTNDLDRTARARLMDVLSKLDAALLIISHDLDFLDRLTSRICRLEQGVVDCSPRIKVHIHAHVHDHGDAPHAHGPHGQPVVADDGKT